MSEQQKTCPLCSGRGQVPQVETAEQRAASTRALLQEVALIVRELAGHGLTLTGVLDGTPVFNMPRDLDK
jgi:hypothetical protein